MEKMIKSGVAMLEVLESRGGGAPLRHPGRQVFTLSGDGAFAMVMQDVITQVRYDLPVINVVFSNDSLGFIDAEQEDTRQLRFGVDLTGADYAAIRRGMGAEGYTVIRPEELAEVFDLAARAIRPVVIEVKIDPSRPFPSEAMILDERLHSPAEVAAFRERYKVKDMPLLGELL